MSNQLIKAKKDVIVACMTCPLCHKLFRDATTISECLHTCQSLSSLTYMGQSMVPVSILICSRFSRLQCFQLFLRSGFCSVCVVLAGDSGLRIWVFRICEGNCNWASDIFWVFQLNGNELSVWSIPLGNWWYIWMVSFSDICLFLCRGKFIVFNWSFKRMLLINLIYLCPMILFWVFCCNSLISLTNRRTA